MAARIAPNATTPNATTPNLTTATAFLAIVILGGVNAVAVRFSNHELPPFWGATLRFGIAALVLLGIVGVRRIRLPRGTALTGSVLYGVLGFAGAFGLIYRGLVEAPAGLGQVILALVPLLTLLFAVGLGVERFRAQGLVGALIAFVGIAIVFGERLGAGVPLGSMLAVLGGAACMAGSNVVAKRFPKCHPLAMNAVAMSTGAAILFVASVLAREAHVLPTQDRTWAAVAYVSVVGSVAVFSLFLYVIQRWTASTSSYVMLLMPLVTVAVAAVLAGESVTAGFALGGVFVVAGVYVGAFAPPITVGRPAAVLATASGPAEPIASQPGCA